MANGHEARMSPHVLFGPAYDTCSEDSEDCRAMGFYRSAANVHFAHGRKEIGDVWCSNDERNASKSIAQNPINPELRSRSRFQCRRNPIAWSRDGAWASPIQSAVDRMAMHFQTSHVCMNTGQIVSSLLSIPPNSAGN